MIGELQAYYKREFTDFARRTWYKHLNAQITTDQFIQAIESAIVSKQFMPTPQELVESICGDSDTQAFVEWDLCIKAASRADKSMLSGLSAQGQSALHLVGGLYKLGQMQEDKLEWVKKEFVAIWKATPATTKSLPQSRTHGSQGNELDIECRRGDTPPCELSAVRSIAAASASLSQKLSLNGNGKAG